MGADCGSDHELLIAKFRMKLKKVGETTRPFRYDLNQILYEATLQQYVNCELPDVQPGFRKGRGTRDQIATSVGSRKKQESSRKHLVLLY